MQWSMATIIQPCHGHNVRCQPPLQCRKHVFIYDVLLCEISSLYHIRFIHNSEDGFPTSFDYLHIIFISVKPKVHVSRSYPLPRLGQRAWILLRSRAWTFLAMWRHGRRGMMRPWKMAIGTLGGRVRYIAVANDFFERNFLKNLSKNFFSNCSH